MDYGRKCIVIRVHGFTLIRFLFSHKIIEEKKSGEEQRTELSIL